MPHATNVNQEHSQDTVWVKLALFYTHKIWVQLRKKKSWFTCKFITPYSSHSSRSFFSHLFPVHSRVTRPRCTHYEGPTPETPAQNPPETPSPAAGAGQDRQTGTAGTRRKRKRKGTGRRKRAEDMRRRRRKKRRCTDRAGQEEQTWSSCCRWSASQDRPLMVSQYSCPRNS